MSLANGLSILFIFSKNQLLALLIFAMVSFVSFALISALICVISFLLLTLEFFISSFSSRFCCKIKAATDHTEVWPRGATPRWRSRAVAESNPTSEEWQLHGRRRAKKSYSTFKVRRGGCEEIPLIQGKEQCLCFAGAAIKRYPTSKVRDTPRPK